MADLDFVKMQAAGNDFVVVNAVGLPDVDWRALSPSLCRRHFGIGSDGLIVVDASPAGGWRARMFDMDGHEDFCGNGTRCAAVFLHHEGLVSSDAFELDTLWGRLAVVVHVEAGRSTGATVNMGRAKFDPAAIPANFPGQTILQQPLEVGGETFTISTVTTGTAHTIVFSDELPDDESFCHWSPLIDKHEAFPEDTNVLWAVVESRHRVRLRIWERGGIGETLACGTGACAVAAVGRRLGLTGDRVTVASKGGELTVELAPGGQARLSGPTSRVFTGRTRLGAGGLPTGMAKNA